MIEDAAGQAGKPRLVFFQWDHSPNLATAAYLSDHMRQHADCLRNYFAVTVVDHDCDFSEVCDRYEPDMVLFEAGYRTHGSRRIRIENTSANPGVLRAGLHNADPWCDRRSGFLSDMERWGVDAFFAIGTLTPSYTPSIADKTFVWPNFIDPKVFRDYGEAKSTTVMITGQVNNLYPWRQENYDLLRTRYPSFDAPTAPYGTAKAATQLMGARYARALNASKLVPACGTVAGEVVRKHFEVPGSLSCLVAERTPALEAAGFVDMENCVFADRSDILDKVDSLLSDDDKLARITRSGHELVHSRHTNRHRPQLLEWYLLRQSLAPGARIVQMGPFSDLVAVEAHAETVSAHISAAGADRRLLREGDLLLEAGRLIEAKAKYEAVLKFIGYLPEAKLRLAQVALLEGKPAVAQSLASDLVTISTLVYGAADPDPVEWAMFVCALLCQGKQLRAKQALAVYPALSNPDLDCLRKALGLPRGTGARQRPSVHRLPIRDGVSSFSWLAMALDAAGQQRLRRALVDEGPRPSGFEASSWTGALLQASYMRIDYYLGRFGLDRLRPSIPPMPEFHYPSRLVYQVARSSIRGAARTTLLQIRDAVRSRWRSWLGDQSPARQ